MDYQFRLVERGAGVSISQLEYSYWRKTGNAYEFAQKEDAVVTDEGDTFNIL